MLKSTLGMRFLVAGIVFLCVALVLSCTDEKKSSTTPQQEQSISSQAQEEESEASEDTTTGRYRIPPYFENPDAAGTLASTLDPATVRPSAQSAYVVARNRPKLLAQLPCFCYCDKFGHQSLHDCFVSDHAETCDLCIKEALEADKMEMQGISPQEIRSVIIAKYHPANKDTLQRRPHGLKV